MLTSCLSFTHLQVEGAIHRQHNTYYKTLTPTANWWQIFTFLDIHLSRDTYKKSRPFFFALISSLFIDFKGSLDFHPPHPTSTGLYTRCLRLCKTLGQIVFGFSIHVLIIESYQAADNACYINTYYEQD